MGSTGSGSLSFVISWTSSNDFYLDVQIPGTTIEFQQVYIYTTSPQYVAFQSQLDTAIPGTYGNKVVTYVANSGLSPAPLSGQTHNYGTVASANITLDTCNLYETRFATGTISTSGTNYSVFLPSGGTYQWINATNGYCSESAGGTALEGSTSTFSFVIIYRRIA